MNDAPERIWLLPFDGEQRCWCDDPDPSGLGHEGDATEYVRADLHETRTAQMVSTLKDRAYIMAERDRTFALMLARAEAAEAERDQWIKHAKNAVWSDSEELKVAEAERDALRVRLDALDDAVGKFMDQVDAAAVAETIAALNTAQEPKS